MLELRSEMRSTEAVVRADLERLDYELKTHREILEAESPDLGQLSEVQSSTTIEFMEGQAAALELELSSLLTHSNESHQPVQRVRASLEKLRSDIAAKIEEIASGVLFKKQTAAESKRAELAVHQASLKKVEERLDVLRERFAERRALAMKRDLAIDHFKVVNLRLDQRLVEDISEESGDVEVVISSYGSVPTKPSFPPPLPLLIVVGVVFGFLLALLTVVLLDLVDDTFVTGDAVEEKLGVALPGLDSETRASIG